MPSPTHNTCPCHPTNLGIVSLNGLLHNLDCLRYELVVHGGDTGLRELVWSAGRGAGRGQRAVKVQEQGETVQGEAAGVHRHKGNAALVRREQSAEARDKKVVAMSQRWLPLLCASVVVHTQSCAAKRTATTPQGK